MSSYPGPSRHTYSENDSVNVGIGAVGTVLFQKQVPSKARFILEEIGNYLGTIAAWSFVAWHILKNGQPWYPYGTIVDQIGYAAQRQKVENLEAEGGALIQVTADNPTAAIVAVGVSIQWTIIDNQE